jgi:hypothetical protein
VGPATTFFILGRGISILQRRKNGWQMQIHAVYLKLSECKVDFLVKRSLYIKEPLGLGQLRALKV